MNIENKSVENTDTQFKKSSSDLTVLSLFSGCGGMDLGFEGDFDTLSASINEIMHPDWAVGSIKKDMWVHLSKTRFHNIFANDIRKDAQEAWTNYFSKKGIDKDVYHLGSIVDLVKFHDESGVNVFPKNISFFHFKFRFLRKGRPKGHSKKLRFTLTLRKFSYNI